MEKAYNLTKPEVGLLNIKVGLQQHNKVWPNS